jgi:hypothetical protein
VSISLFFTLSLRQCVCLLSLFLYLSLCILSFSLSDYVFVPIYSISICLHICICLYSFSLCLCIRMSLFFPLSVSNYFSYFHSVSVSISFSALTFFLLSISVPLSILFTPWLLCVIWSKDKRISSHSGYHMSTIRWDGWTDWQMHFQC